MGILERIFGEREEPEMDPQVASQLAQAKRIEAQAIERLAETTKKDEGKQSLRNLAELKRGEAAVYESFYEQEEFDAITEDDGAS